MSVQPRNNFTTDTDRLPSGSVWYKFPWEEINRGVKDAQPAHQLLAEGGFTCARKSRQPDHAGFEPPFAKWNFIP